jgi:hypothetical protein
MELSKSPALAIISKAFQKMTEFLAVVNIDKYQLKIIQIHLFFVASYET